MTDLVDEKDVRPRENSPQAHSRLAVPVKSGHAEEQVVELELGNSVTTILEIFAAERACLVEELVLVREGEDGPLTSTIMVDAKYPHTRCHHVHYPGEVTVTVCYQADRLSRTFKRFEQVKEVLTWAIEVFNIDASLATEFELARHGQKEELPEPEHIGHLAGKDCELALDLVRGDIANGSPS